MRYSLFKKPSKAAKTAVFNSFITLAWWFLFNPGFFSSDSFGVLEMIKGDTITSESTAIWAISVKILTFNGSHPEIATLFFSQLLSLSVTLFAYTLFEAEIARKASILLCMTPVVGAMGITLWHDIPMTSGFLLIVVGVAGFMNKRKFSIGLILLGVILSSYRYNGIPTIFLAALIILLFFAKYRPALIILCFFSIVVGGLTAILDTKLSPATQTHDDGFINWMRYDLSCYAANFKDDIYFQKAFNGIASREYWESSKSCTWFNDSNAFKYRSHAITEKIPSAWLKLLQKKPEFILTTHMKRHSYLLPIPFFGLPQMPFIHSTIEFPNSGISHLNPDLSRELRIYPRVWNFFRFITGYAGLWLLFIFFMAVIKRNPLYLSIGIVGLVLNAGLFVFAIISDARFTLFVLISAQLIAVGEFARSLTKRRARRSVLQSSTKGVIEL